MTTTEKRHGVSLAIGFLAQVCPGKLTLVQSLLVELCLGGLDDAREVLHGLKQHSSSGVGTAGVPVTQVLGEAHVAVDTATVPLPIRQLLFHIADRLVRSEVVCAESGHDIGRPPFLVEVVNGLACILFHFIEIPELIGPLGRRATADVALLGSGASADNLVAPGLGQELLALVLDAAVEVLHPLRALGVLEVEVASLFAKLDLVRLVPLVALGVTCVGVEHCTRACIHLDGSQIPVRGQRIASTSVGHDEMAVFGVLVVTIHREGQDDLGSQKLVVIVSNVSKIRIESTDGASCD